MSADVCVSDACRLVYRALTVGQSHSISKIVFLLPHNFNGVLPIVYVHVPLVPVFLRGKFLTLISFCQCSPS